AWRGLLASSLISNARLPPEAVAVKAPPRLRLTWMLSATAPSLFSAGARVRTCGLRKAKSPWMCTKLAKSARKLIALKETTPAPRSEERRVGKEWSPPARLTALATQGFYYTVGPSGAGDANPPAVDATARGRRAGAPLPR